MAGSARRPWLSWAWPGLASDSALGSSPLQVAPHAGAWAKRAGTAGVYLSSKVQEHKRTGGSLQGLSKLLLNTGPPSLLPTAHGPMQVINEPNTSVGVGEGSIFLLPWREHGRERGA